jgi:hypothetical protein
MKRDISGPWRGEFRGKPQVRAVLWVMPDEHGGIVAYSTGGDRIRYVMRSGFLRWMRRTRAARPVQTRKLVLR